MSGTLPSTDQFKNLLINIVNPFKNIKMTAVNTFRNFLQTFTKAINSLDVCLADGFDTFFGDIKKVYDTIKSIHKMIGQFNDKIDGAQRKIGKISSFMTEIGKQRCDILTIVLTGNIDIDFAIFDVDASLGLYLTFDVTLDDPLKEVGMVGGANLQTTYDEGEGDKKKWKAFGVEAGFTFAIGIGEMMKTGGLGYSVALDFELGPVAFSPGLIFEEKEGGLGAFSGFSFTFSVDLVALATSKGVANLKLPTMDEIGNATDKLLSRKSISCGFEAASNVTIEKNELATKCNQTLNPEKTLTFKENLKGLYKDAKDLVDAFKNKWEEIKACAKIYKCAFKQCVYNVQNIGQSFSECKPMLNECADKTQGCLQRGDKTECT